MACAGASSAICGGSNAINLYVNTAGASAEKLSADYTTVGSSSSSSASGSTSGSGSSSGTGSSTGSGSGSGSSTSVTLPSGWQVASVSCIAEGSNGRVLASGSTASDSMTVETCVSYCNTLGFGYAGMEYGE
jgi:hypothetical protein